MQEATRSEWYSQVQDGEEVELPSSQQQTQQEQENIRFTDTTTSYVAPTLGTTDSLADAAMMDAVSLAKFLSRPVKIQTYTWAESDAVGNAVSFAPWHLFFNDTRIKYKLNNWAFIKCNLKLKIMLNASPFYYGAAMLSWRPLTTFKGDTIIDDGASLKFIPLSQRPKVMIYPQSNEGAEMTLPFVWPAQFLRCSLASDFTEMGSLTLSLITQLQSATGVTGAGITIQVYAWAEDVVLGGPTIGLSMQDDEYATGPISRPASAIAALTGRLGDIPIIGKFATATSIGAGAVSSIAKLFGYTDVPQIDNHSPVVPKPYPAMASADIGHPIEKLTIDSKNELTVDKSSIGIEQIDELVVSNMVQRESFLTSFSWTTAGAADALLWNTAIAPQAFYDCASATNWVQYQTPLSWMGTMFQYWRGDIILRFRVVCSQYHKGRLRISFDPDGYSGTNITNDAASSSVVMTEIVDICKDTDVEMRIPYQQFCAWCKTRAASSNTFAAKMHGTSALFAHTRGSTNGTVTVRIMNQLSAPVASSTIQVLVFVRGAENLEYAAPSLDGADRMTSLTLQDAETPVNKGEPSQEIVVSGKILTPVDHLYLTYMGEQIRSLRSVLRRKTLALSAVPAQAGTEALAYTIQSLYRLPPTFGYDTNGLDTAKGVVTTGTTYNFNWAQNTFIQYVSQAFLGYRGAVNWNILAAGTRALPSVRSYRDPLRTTIQRVTGNQAFGTAGANNKWMWEKRKNGTQGQALACQLTNAGLNISVPFYSYFKFATTDVSQQCAPPSTWGEQAALWTTEVVCDNSSPYPLGHLFLDYYVSAGTDFDVIMFLNVPTFTYMADTPVAV